MCNVNFAASGKIFSMYIVAYFMYNVDYLTFQVLVLQIDTETLNQGRTCLNRISSLKYLTNTCRNFDLVLKLMIWKD